MACIASWEAVEELGDNCPLCGRACYVHELEDDRAARLAADPSSAPAYVISAESSLASRDTHDGGQDA